MGLISLTIWVFNTIVTVIDHYAAAFLTASLMPNKPPSIPMSRILQLFIICLLTNHPHVCLYNDSARYIQTRLQQGSLKEQNRRLITPTYFHNLLLLYFTLQSHIFIESRLTKIKSMFDKGFPCPKALPTAVVLCKQTADLDNVE